jgi:phosphatidylinositol alpha-1,6-mannosyltransferase
LPKKNILIVTSEFPPQPGGIGKHALDLATALHQEGFKVLVMSDERSEEGMAEASFDAQLPFIVRRIKYRRVRPLMYLMRIVLLFKLLKTCDDVIATGKFSLWAVAFCNLFFKKHSLAVIHGTEVNLKQPLAKQMVLASLKRFDKVVAVSHYTAQLIAHLKIPVQVIPNGIFNSQWHQSGLKKTSLQGSPALITVGRVSPRKGQLQVIKHLPGLLNIYPDAHYHCVGIDSQKAACIKTAQDLGVQNRVHFHGAVTNDTLKDMLAGSDIVVMLSAEANDGDVEGFGIALLEANALGIPAIGAIGCGIEDAVNDGISGRLIEPTHADVFIKAVDEVLHHHQAYSEGAKAWAERHDWTILIKQYCKLLS